MKRSCVVVGVLVVLVLGAVASEAVAGSKEDMAAIEKVRKMEEASVNEGSPDQVANIYAKNVTYLPPNEPALEGTDAVRGWLEAMIEQVDVVLKYTDSDVTLKGDLAFEQYTGVVTMTPKEGGEPMTENVRGIHIYQRGEDGAWRITHDIWNTDTPAH